MSHPHSNHHSNHHSNPNPALKVIAQAGNEDLARVYLSETRNGDLVEFVESLQPPFTRDEKWVLIVSPLLGCPVGCPMCDAGGWYKGKLSRDEILAQIDYMVHKRFGTSAATATTAVAASAVTTAATPISNPAAASTSKIKIPAKKFKIQFARMGEPAFNTAVLDVLCELPQRYDAPGLLPSISTVAPHGQTCDDFFARLIDIKNQYYADGKFQMQFSIHTSDEKLRDQVIPIKKWDFATIARYGENFNRAGDRKITLNFALAQEYPLDASVLRAFFDPELFLIKLTPINPTLNAQAHQLHSGIDPYHVEKSAALIGGLEAAGYEVLLSIGELEENKIGSNCGQYIKRFLDARANADNDDSSRASNGSDGTNGNGDGKKTMIKDSYEYQLESCLEIVHDE